MKAATKFQLAFLLFIGFGIATLSAAEKGLHAENALESMEVSEVGGIAEGKGIKLSAFCYQSGDQLVLDVEDACLSVLSYQLFDTQGELLKENEVSGAQASIDTQNLLPAIYLMRVVCGNKEVKTFKITKR